MTAFLKTCAASVLLAATFAATAASDDTPVNTPAEAQIAVRDAATGKLRMPTAVEIKALRDSGALTAMAKQPATQLKIHSSGAKGVRLNDSFMSHSVMVKQPDGTLSEFCFSNIDNAQAALDAAPQPQTLPTE